MGKKMCDNIVNVLPFLFTIRAMIFFEAGTSVAVVGVVKSVIGVYDKILFCQIKMQAINRYNFVLPIIFLIFT